MIHKRINIKKFLFRIEVLLSEKLSPTTIERYTKKIFYSDDCKVALDIGCGESSYLSKFRPVLKTIGIDVDESSIEKSKEKDVHDYYINNDVLKLSAYEIKDLIQKKTGFENIDIIAAYDLIEHLPKDLGWEFLKKLEDLANKFIILTCPPNIGPGIMRETWTKRRHHGQGTIHGGTDHRQAA